MLSLQSGTPSPVGVTQGQQRLPLSSPQLQEKHGLVIVWANVSSPLQNTTCAVLVENLSEDISWRVARVLTHVQGGKVPLRVCNPNPYPVHLPLRQTLATVTATDPQNICSQNVLTLDCTAPGVVEVDVRPIQADTSSFVDTEM